MEYKTITVWSAGYKGKEALSQIIGCVIALFLMLFLYTFTFIISINSTADKKSKLITWIFVVLITLIFPIFLYKDIKDKRIKYKRNKQFTMKLYPLKVYLMICQCMKPNERTVFLDICGAVVVNKNDLQPYEDWISPSFTFLDFLTFFDKAKDCEVQKGIAKITTKEISISRNHCVKIIPTLETDYGLADEYNIYTSSCLCLHENVKQNDLQRIIDENHYEVVAGNKWL